MSSFSKSRRDFVKMAGLGLAGAVVSNRLGYGALFNALDKENPPNVLFVLGDDIGYGGLPIYDPQSKIVLPNIKKLAERGMTFTDAHSPTAVCAPTRYSILTGNYPWRGRETFGTWHYNAQCQILDGQKTIGDVFKQKGYHTAMFGKLHMGGHFDSKNKPNELAPFKFGVDYKEIDFSKRFRRGPLDYGFDYSFLLLGGNHGEPYAYFENDKLVGDPNEVKFYDAGTYGNSIIPSKGVGMPYYDSTKLGIDLTRKTVAFIDEHHKNNVAKGTKKPFFIHYCSQAIHNPCTPPDELGNVKIKGHTPNAITDMLLEIDASLGVFMDELQKRDLLKNTLIVFTSDNGAWPFDEFANTTHKPNCSLRGWKGQIWEGGHRVPLIVAWGDGTKKGSSIRPDTRCDQLVGLQDFYATFVELTRQKMEEGQGLDSVSILPALLQKTEQPIRQHLVIQANKNFAAQNPLLRSGPGDSTFFRALRENEWKLIVDDKGTGLELYSLKEDLQEVNNLIKNPDQKDRIERMQLIYAEIVKSGHNRAHGVQVSYGNHEAFISMG